MMFQIMQHGTLDITEPNLADGTNHRNTIDGANQSADGATITQFALMVEVAELWIKRTIVGSNLASRKVICSS
ncbi:hypothetical protein O9929_20625 [Vibrio lentus]|nr:hypothetical protein [Vibrio lentus]